MDTFRYYAALVLVVTFPPAFAFWFFIHPFIGFWRRLGFRFTYAIMFPAMLAACYGLFRVRGSLLAIDYGTQWVLVGLGVVLYAVASVVEIKCRRYLKLRTLVGIPELEAADEGPGKLLNDGIYARVRHPRYLGIMLGGTGVACIANNQATWVLMAALVPVTYLLTVIEERELRVRFGEQYTRYAEQVPRIIPRIIPRRG
ncbi:MAG: isoprenylcysteine carboxylmethyltransferase family protein [Acidobacteria bacterium]|nr:isoprenylcysteine carboxylmethyltransferase family protein [Acidobacteriota bacterium]